MWTIRGRMPRLYSPANLPGHRTTNLPHRLGLRIGAKHLESDRLFRERRDRSLAPRLGVMSDELDEKQIPAPMPWNRERFDPGHIQPGMFEDGHGIGQSA